MSRIAVLAGLVLLSACTPKEPPPEAPGFRDGAAPFSSIALFDPARFQGRWYEIARFPVPVQAGCQRTRSDYILGASGDLAVQLSCQRDGALRRFDGVATPSGPGRLQVRFDETPELSASYWILWVDEGYRTAVVGVPSGRLGWILNRDPVIPPDRLTAAREILEFNGYDLTQLRRTPQ